MFLSPSLALGFVLSTMYGAAFHLLVGGDARRLAFFLISGWLGFVLGQWFGSAFYVTIFSIGPLHVFSATLGSLITLILARFLTGARQTDL